MPAYGPLTCLQQDSHHRCEPATPGAKAKCTTPSESPGTGSDKSQGTGTPPSLHSIDSQATLVMGSASGKDAQIDTPRRALLQTPSSSEKATPAASVHRSGAAKTQKAKCQKKPMKGKKVTKSKLKKKTSGGKPQVSEKGGSPPNQVAPGNQGGGVPVTAPTPPEKIVRSVSEEDPLGMLARATTQDMLSDHELEGAVRNPPPTEEPTPPDQQVAPGPPVTKPKRKNRDKELHNRKMRFYRSLDSQPPNEVNAMITYSMEKTVTDMSFHRFPLSLLPLCEGSAALPEVQKLARNARAGLG